MISDLDSLLDEELDRLIPPEVEWLAEAAKARHPPGSIEAVLFYGSCWRDGRIGDGMVDLYLLATSYRHLHPNSVTRFFARLLPPNVYFIDTKRDGRYVRGKYALMTLTHFERKVSATTRNPYFWARFAQPTGIVSATEPGRVKAALKSAMRSLYAHARDLSPRSTSDDRCDGENERFWLDILRQTYRTELRVEKANRIQGIYLADKARYDRIKAILDGESAIPAAHPAPWWLRRIEGRLLTAGRLIKAGATFRGGPDYLAWKIERHSGVQLQLKDWQRRYPLIAAGPILWRLLRDRTVR